jgi:hypothetical protein
VHADAAFFTARCALHRRHRTDAALNAKSRVVIRLGPVETKRAVFAKYVLRFFRGRFGAEFSGGAIIALHCG